MKARIARVLALGVLPALLAGACGGKGSSSSGGSLGLTPGAIAAAAVKTSAAKSARVVMSMTMSGVEASEDTPEAVTMTAEGRMALGKLKGILTMDMGGLGLPGVDSKIEVRLLDTLMFMKIPAVAGEEFPMPKGKKWMKLDLSSLGKEAGFDLADLQNFGLGNDPTKTLSYLKSVGSVEKVGPETVRGAKTTRYKAAIDFDKALKELGASLGASAGSDELQKLLGNNKTLPSEVWIGDDGLLRRMDFTMNLAGLEDLGQDAKMSMSMELYDFGVSLEDVAAPPAAEVFDFEQIMAEEDAASS